MKIVGAMSEEDEVDRRSRWLDTEQTIGRCIYFMSETGLMRHNADGSVDCLSRELVKDNNR